MFWCVVLVVSVGNVFEYYDLLIYGYFVIIIGKLFFLMGDVWSLLMFFVGMFGVLFIMWLLGLMVFGSYVDCVGCKVVLMWLIFLMMLGMVMIVFVLMYVLIGLWLFVIVIVV